jgi:hypothetical protein
MADDMENMAPADGDFAPDEEEKSSATNRDAELSKRKGIREQVLKIGKLVEKGFENQKQRAEINLDHWDSYNGQLSDRQFYNGTSQLFMPFTHDALEARKTRFSNQLFPQNGRYVEVTTEDGDIPHATMAILEHYVRHLRLKSQVIEPLILNGDIEGHYTVYVGWEEHTRTVTRRVDRPLEVDGMEVPEDVEGPIEDMEEEEINDAYPVVEVIADNDFLLLPSTARDIDHALAIGGSATVIRRWSKEEIKRRADKGEIDKTSAERLGRAMSRKDQAARTNTAKKLASAAGIKLEGDDKLAVIYEVWTNLKTNDGYRLCRILWAGEEYTLSVKRGPYWCDMCPIISSPQDKVAGVFKGRSPVGDVLDLQIFANDTINEAADSAHFSALPIIMTDPAKNPRVESLVLGPAAIWKTSPNDTQFAKFPEMWKDGIERSMTIRGQIFQTLGVNPAMIPGTTGGKQKRNQAEIAQEQQVDILTTAAAVMVLEENLLTPLLTRFLEYDHQFRDKSIMVRSFGEVGRKAVMEEVEPLQVNRRYEFRWFGVEAARNAAQMQQQIAGINVMRSIPPNLYPGYKLNLAPVIVQMMEGLFGPRIAPLVFVEEQAMSVDPKVENEMLLHGFDAPIHPPDNDMEHLQVHMEAMQQGDPHGTIRKHVTLHMQAMQMKAAAAQNQAKGPGQPSQGGPGPAPGGQPGPPQSQPGAPGQIPPDQLSAAGAPQMPRK